LQKTYPTMVADKDDSESDEALIAAIRNDPAEFSKLYRRYAARLYRYLYGRVGNLGDAEDLTSQVFIEVLEALPRYQAQNKFPAWLFTIARRRAADYHRNKASTAPMEWLGDLPSSFDDPQANLITNQALEKLAQLYGSLDEDKQELLRLRYAAELSYKEIGQLTQRSEAAAGMAIRRILQWLKEHWEAENE